MNDDDRRILRRRDESGVYSMMFVLLLAAILAAGALAVDMGTLYFARHSTKAVADMAVTAGGLALEPTTGGNPRQACQDAWSYAVINLPDAPNSALSPCGGMPTSGASCSPSATPIVITGTVNDASGSLLYTISITWPVADGDPRMDARLTGEIDGSQCQRLGVSIERDNNLLLAGFGDGPDRLTVGNGSVSRTQASLTQGDLVALVVLDRTNCQALRVGGQGHAIVEAVQVPDGAGNLVWVPGAITVDSDGSGSCGPNPRYAIAPTGNHPNSYIIAENTADGSPGVILSHAMLTNPGRSHDPSKCGANGSPTASTPIQPCPVGGLRVTRAPIDHRYNCKSSYPAAMDIAGCAAATAGSDYIDQLVAAHGGSSATPVPTNGAFITGAFSVYPRAGHPADDCRLNSSVVIDLGPGNWFIDCPNTGGSGNTPGFRMSNGGARFSAGPGEIVFAGGIDVSDGIFAIGNNTDPSIVYARPHPSNEGDFEKGAQGQMILRNTFVYLQNGVLDVGAGSPTLTWIAPDVPDFPFDDLALWSEQSGEHLLGGQGNLDVEGTFFTPNAAPFNFSGQGAQSQTRAQFITWQLEFSGQAGLRMRPDPERSTPIPIQGVTLIR